MANKVKNIRALSSETADIASSALPASPSPIYASATLILFSGVGVDSAIGNMRLRAFSNFPCAINEST